MRARSLLLLAGLAACAPDPAPSFRDESPEPPAALRGSRQARPLAYPYTTILFLELEGATILKGVGSDAPSATSYLCGGSFPAFDHARYGADREAVLQALEAKTAALFADFNLEVTRRRPSAAPYDMVVVGGRSSLCGYPDGLGGLGPLDCGDGLHSDISFAFADTVTSLDLLAVVIAHEAAHGYGLRHTTEGCDAMSYGLCQGGIDKRFLDRQMELAPDQASRCDGSSRQSSWQVLEAVLGRHPGPAEGAGCRLGESSTPAPREVLVLGLLAALLGVLRRSRTR